MKLTIICNLLLSVLILYSCDTNKELPEKTDIFALTAINKNLPNILKEQSGLLYYQDMFWAINDSGAEAKIYVFDKKGTIKRSILVVDTNNEPIVNIDWEDITDDNNYIYIGDFGNNLGMRKNLRILKIDKRNLYGKDTKRVKAEILNFSWAEQKNFKRRNLKHNFDCEAFFATGDSLYLFTKNWLDKKTSMYVMSNKGTSEPLHKKSSFDVNFCVTGADISSDKKEIILVGYNNYKTYIRTFGEFKGRNFLSGESKLYFLKSLGRAQTEGIVYDTEDYIYISTEDNWRDRIHQSIYEFKILK